MTWSEAFTTVGIAMAWRWWCIRFAAGGKVLKNAPHTDVERLRCGDRELVK